MRSLSFRLTVWYACVVTLTTIIMLVVGRYYLEHAIIHGVDLLNEAEFEEVKSRLLEMGGVHTRENIIEAIGEHAELDASLYFFQVGIGQEEIFFKSGNLGNHYLPKAVHGKPVATVYDDELGPLRSGEFQVGGLDIHIASSLQNYENLFENYERFSIYLCVCIFFISMAIGYALSRVALNPIKAIQQSARRITASRLTERLPVPRTGDEIADMVNLLNDMLSRLEKSYAQVRRFTAEASHEFRTPLSIIRLQAEKVLGTPEMAIEERNESMEDMMEEIGNLNKLIDDLLLLAKADAGVIPLEIKAVDLKDYLKSFREDAELLASEKQINFRLEESFQVDIWHFDPKWTRHVLFNLLSNALKYSPVKSTLTLSVEVSEGFLIYRLADEGRGIPEDHLERIFERFARIENGEVSEGNGLGLAICRSLIERQRGSIVARNRTEGGLEITFTIPGKTDY